LIKGNWDQTQNGGGLGRFANAGVANLRFYRLDFSLFATAVQACINGAGTGWFTAYCYIHDNKSGGWMLGTDATMIGGKVYRNGQLGIKTAGGGVDNILVDGTEVYENNFQGWNTLGFEAGGMKFVGAQPTNMTMRRCHFHHNNGPGIWYDFTGGGNLIEDCLSHDNVKAGIFYEGSGPAVIRRNTTYNNGGAAGIYIASSNGDWWVDGTVAPIYGTRDVFVEDNICYGHNGHAEIWLKDDPSRDIPLGHVTVRRNRIRRAPTASFNDIACGQFGNTVPPPDVIIDDNDYFTDIGSAWSWLGTERTWAQWQALGFDANGSLSPFSEF
jgi:hypothetical protein